MKHQIRAIITDTHIEFRNFPKCEWFDPIDDLMFLPLQIPNLPKELPDTLSPEYICLDDDNKEFYDSDNYHARFYGLRWNISLWCEYKKKIARSIFKDIKERFEPDVDVIIAS